MPDQAVKDLFMMEGFSCTRLLPIEGGVGWHKVLREVGFYRSQRFGRAGPIMETWKNPLTKEEVEVVPIANEPSFVAEAPVHGSGPRVRYISFQLVISALLGGIFIVFWIF